MDTEESLPYVWVLSSEFFEILGFDWFEGQRAVPLGPNGQILKWSNGQI
jgi:hypothetical protein